MANYPKSELLGFSGILSPFSTSSILSAHTGTFGSKAVDVKVMGQCGHLLGRECCAENDCPVFGCSAYNRDNQKLDGSSLIQSASQWHPEDDRNHWGGKSTRRSSTLNKLEAIVEKDKNYSDKIHRKTRLEHCTR
jgi:hypothetical protein